MRQVAGLGGDHGIVLDLTHHLLEVKVAGFEIRCVGIGDVARNDFQALAASAQRFSMHAQCVVQNFHGLTFPPWQPDAG